MIHSNSSYHKATAQMLSNLILLFPSWSFLHLSLYHLLRLSAHLELLFLYSETCFSGCFCFLLFTEFCFHLSVWIRASTNRILSLIHLFCCLFYKMSQTDSESSQNQRRPFGFLLMIWLQKCENFIISGWSSYTFDKQFCHRTVYCSLLRWMQLVWVDVKW